MARQYFPTTDFLEISTHPAYATFQAPLTKAYKNVVMKVREAIRMTSDSNNNSIMVLTLHMSWLRSLQGTV